MKNLRLMEVLVLIMTVIVILVSQYYYMVEKNEHKAIFIGLWPPTMLVLLNFLNLIKPKN